MAKATSEDAEVDRVVYVFFDSDNDPKKRARDYCKIVGAAECDIDCVIVDVLGDAEELKFHKNGTIEVVGVVNEKVVGRLVNPDPDPATSEIQVLTKKMCARKK